MKKMIFAILIFVALGAGAQQKVTKDSSGVYKNLTVKKATTPPKQTGNYYLAPDGKKYPIYVSENGKFFVVRISKKTGKPYRQYLAI